MAQSGTLLRKMMLMLSFSMAAGFRCESGGKNPIVAPEPRPMSEIAAACKVASEVVAKNADAQPNQYAEVAIDATTGEALVGENEKVRVYPASLTKMMTLYLVFEALENKSLVLNQQVLVSKDAAEVRMREEGAVTIDLKEGQTISVSDLIPAAAIKSANDGAIVLAEVLSGTEKSFTDAMNAKACQLGMTDTHFANSSGLPNEKNFSTVRDMAVLARAVLRDFPQYYHYFGDKFFTYNGKRHYNRNHLIGVYPGMDGMKTGYISESGFNLAASAKRGDTRLIGIVIGSRTPYRRNKRMVHLLNNAFEKSRQHKAMLKKKAAFKRK